MVPNSIFMLCRFRTRGGKALSVYVQLDDDLQSGDMGELVQYQVFIEIKSIQMAYGVTS